MRLNATLLVICATLASLLMAPPVVAQRNLQIPPLRTNMVVSTDWLADHLRDPQIVILHIAKNRADYDAGHIPYARFVPLDNLVTARKALTNELPPVAKLEHLFGQLGIADNSTVVLYGDLSGLCATRAYWTLDYLGHGDRAAILDGGLEKWRSEERPVTTADERVVPAKFTARVNRRVLTTLPAARELSNAIAAGKTRAALIDSRPADDYAGESRADILPRPGHIPGAADLFWQKLIAGKDDPQLRPVPEMRNLFHAAGARESRRVIVYCRTGMQASFAYFVAKLLGFDVSLYDGSFQEWSNTRTLPVKTGRSRVVAE